MRHQFARNNPYDPDAAALFARRAALSDTVPVAYRNAINRYVRDLKAIPGHWDAITQLVVFAGAATVSGGLEPIKGPKPTQTGLVTGDFALKTGVKGEADTNSKVILTGYDSLSFGQDNIHSYMLVTEISTTGKSFFGHVGATGGWSMNWNNNARGHTSAASTHTANTVGGYGLSRSSSANYQRMLADNVDTITQTSEAPSAGLSMRLLARSATGNTAINSSDARILVWAIGPAATLSNYTTPGNTLQTALNAI